MNKKPQTLDDSYGKSAVGVGGVVHARRGKPSANLNAYQVLRRLGVGGSLMPFVLLLSFLFHAAVQAVTLDGVIDSDYFRYGNTIDYQGAAVGAGAKLYAIDNTTVDAGNIWLSWVIDKGFNDNSYGATWPIAGKHTSWSSGHSFGDLAESDKQRMQFFNSCGELVADATMDLLDGPGEATDSGYGVDMDAAESVKTSINGNDWSKFAYDTSLASNLNDLGYCAGGTDCSVGGTNLYTTSPIFASQSDHDNFTPPAAYSDWEYDLLWEVRVDRSVFVTATCPQGGVSLPDIIEAIELHASPSKPGETPVRLARVGASIGDRVWLDADRDGVQDPDESGLANVTVALWTDPNGDGNTADGSIIATVVTGVDGYYLFNALGSANYVVDVTDSNGILSGLSLTTGSSDPHAVSLAVAEQYLGADFGHAPTDTTTALIGDYVWSDADNDGLQDAGEPGIGGVTVDLIGPGGDGILGTADDVVVATTTTSADGSYRFTGVAAGDYRVDITDTGNVLTGYSLTSGAHSNSDPTAPMTVATGDVSVNADFGYHQAGLGQIGNQVFRDVDEDGHFDAGEDGIADVTIELIQDSNGNGVWDSGEYIIATAITDASGTYQFSGLDLNDGDGDADYLVHISDTNDELWRRFILTDGVNGSDSESQPDPYAIALSSGATSNQTADFGFIIRPGEADNGNPKGLVGDRVWFDLDGNGIEDSGEAGIAGVTVELYKDKNSLGTITGQDTLLGTLTTDAEGYYYFPQLTLKKNQDTDFEAFVVSSNFDPGGPLEGLTATNQPDNVDEAAGLRAVLTQNMDFSVDFGYEFSGNTYDIGGIFWLDNDGNGVYEPNGADGIPGTADDETGIDGVTAEVRDSSGTLLGTTTSGGGGGYSIVNLPDGDYTVTVTDTAGVLTGHTQTSGSPVQAVTINGADRNDIDFGYVRAALTASIGDTVWLDSNGDGVQAPSESGLYDVKVALYQDDGDGLFNAGLDALIESTRTDASGHYLFSGLAADNYFARVYSATLPNNLIETTYAAGANPSALIDMSDGEQERDVDFGYVPAAGTAALGDWVWYDSDSDGLQDPGEIGISGIDITVLDAGTGATVATATTGADGGWLVTGLAAGGYVVTYDKSDVTALGYSDQATNLPAGDDNYSVTIAAGEMPTQLDFGFSGGTTGSIGDTVYFDVDGNGAQGAGEGGIANVTLNLIDLGADGQPGGGDDTVIATTTTDGTGTYSFTGLPADNYQVVVTDVHGVLAGMNATQTAAAPIAINGNNVLTAVFGYGLADGTGIVGNQIWHDKDGDGVYEPSGNDGTAGTSDDEPGLQGVTVDLWEDDGDGNLGSGDNLLRTATTGSDGGYSFAGIPAGSYFVDVTDDSGVLAGFSKTSGTAGTDDNSQADPYAVTLTAAAPNNLTAEFGYWIPGGGAAYSISGRTFEDVTGNGAYNDPGAGGTDADAFVADATVNLFRIVNGQEVLIGTAITAADGTYSFTNLPTGDYVVRVDVNGTTVDGFEQTVDPDQTGVCTTCDNETTFLNLNSAQTTVDFGYYDGGVVTNPVSLSGFEAIPGDAEGEVLFHWSTATETGNIGFNLYMKEAGEWVLINDSPVPSKAVDSVRTLNYSHRAFGIGATMFAIEDVDIFGVATLHGPYRLGRRYGVIEQAVVNGLQGMAEPANGRHGGKRIDWSTINKEHRMKKEARIQRKRKQMEKRLKKLRREQGDELSQWTGEAPGSVAKPTGPRPSWAEQAIGWLAAFLISPAQAAPVPTEDLLNLEIKEPGIYRVTYEQLKDVGLDLGGIGRKRVTLSNRGEKVPIYVHTDKGFGPGAYIDFIGAPVDSLYTDANVYTLGVSKKNGARIKRDKNRITDVAAETYFMKTVVVEPQAMYTFAAPNGDPWYAHRMLAWGGPTERNLEIAAEGYIEDPDPESDADEPALSVSVWGGSDLPGDALRDPDHHVIVELNGMPLADERFDGVVASEISGNPSEALQAGVNVITVKLPFDTGYAFDLANIDKWRITYPSGYRAVGNVLTFAASGKRFEVTGMTAGLTADDVVVYRSSEGNVERLSKLNVGCAAECSVAFRGNSKPATYFVGTVDRLKTPEAMVPVGETVDITSGEAQLLVISHPDFIDRLSDALPTLNPDALYDSVKIVDVEEIYKQFGESIVDAQAIKEYVAFAHANMKTLHVLLVGGDSYDYKNYLDLGAKSFIPTLYTATGPIVTFAPVDPLYTDVDGDWIPDLVIGRLPVRTEAELVTALAKTEAYESKDYDRSAVFAADAYDGFQSYDFKADAEAVISEFLPDWQVEKAYIDDDGIDAARATLIGAINAGVALTSFFGHSGLTLWTFNSPPLLKASELVSLTNVGRPTVVTQWGCWNTFFVSPFEQTMGHQFMLNGDQGAAAVLGASTLTGAEAERELAKELFARLQPGVSIGDAVLEAKRAYAKTHPDQKDVILGWTLLGVPGLKM